MKKINYTRSRSVGTIEMSWPPANTYGIEFVRALDAAIGSAENDSECRVVIVRSSLPGFFCGGADIKQFGANSPNANMEMISVAHEMLSRMTASDRIYIAEINGHALGGGFEIALACDLRFGAEGAYQLGLPEVTLGLLPGNGGTQRLSAIVGPNKALELMISGVRLSPEQAINLGILNRLIKSSELADRTREFANTLAGSATLAVSKIKRSVYDGFCRSLDSGMAIERRNIAVLFSSNDAKEGFSAFAERRKPQFSGK